MKLAAAAYPLDFFASWTEYEAKLTRWVEDGVRQGGELLVFPEYAAMELSSLGGAEIAADLEASLRQTADLAGAANDLHDKLARKYGIWIVAGSGPVFAGRTRPVNRAHLFGPDGPLGYQDKQIMTRFEREQWDVVPGDPLGLFDIGPFKAGVTICYDSEFPELARHVCEQGADLILAPSCTETLAGYSRVRIGTMARALENQCYGLMSPIVGRADWCPGVEAGTGAAGIYGPPDRGFPATGIVAQGELDKAGWVVAEADPALVAEVRANGGVLNFRHWSEQEMRISTVKSDHRDQ
jgi:predicted amidohydrolase